MKTKKSIKRIAASLLAMGLLLIGLDKYVFAHCDSLDGPVVQAARNALAEGDVSPVLKWVQMDDEDVIRNAFQRTLAVRALGGEAKELADMYFFETLVRIHRAGEDAPYTGLKPAETVDPAVALADKALESGSVDVLVEVLTNAIANGIRERFQNAFELQDRADDSVEAGREFVEAYVLFTHYVEGLHAIIQGKGGHHGEGADGQGGHNH